MSQGIFRSVALERLSSPERLDEIVRVTHPRAWISLAGLAAVLAMAMVWGFAGTIPIKVRGSGMIVRPGGVFNVVSQGGGVVTKVLFRPGDLISSGQEVARVAQPLLEQQVVAARSLTTQLEETRRDLAASHAREAALQQASQQQETANVHDQIRNTKASIASLKDAVALAGETSRATDELTAQGLANRQMVAAARNDLLSSRLELSAAEERLTVLSNELRRIDIQRLTLARQREQQLRDLDERLLAARATLSQASSQLRLTSTVVSTYDGAVVDTLIDVGNVIESGAPVLTLEVDLSRRQKGWRSVNEAVVFVPSADAKRIQRGMAAQVSPGDVKAEEYGYMVGHVRHVSKYAATTASMTRLFENDSLVRALEGEGPVNEVIVELIRTDSNPSGYVWSSRKSPPFHIHSGTPCVGQVVTARRRPVELVIPYVRSKLGI